jgi:hypothetical protein
VWQLPVGKLPPLTEIPTSSDALFGHAVQCLNVLVWALNRLVEPVLARLER